VELQLREGDYVIQVAAAGAVASCELVRAAADGSGWRSRYYGSREPALSFAVNARAATILLVTVLAPAPASVCIDAGQIIHVKAGGRTYSLTVDGAAAGAAP
jgi:hypothetical protein